jgi:hypothetical protein
MGVRNRVARNDARAFHLTQFAFSLSSLVMFVCGEANDAPA